MNPTTVLHDHHGKWSQARLCAIIGLLIAGGLAFYRSDVPMEILTLFALGPSGLALWQKWSPIELGRHKAPPKPEG